MINLKRIYNVITCTIFGHTFIYLPCIRCGKASPWELIRNDKGEAVKDEDNYPTYKWKF